MADFSQYNIEDLKKIKAHTARREVGGVFGKVTEREYAEGERNVMGNIGERPGATARAAIRQQPLLKAVSPFAGILGISGVAGEEAQKAAVGGAMRPREVQTFQDERLENNPKGYIGSLVRSGQLPANKATYALNVLEQLPEGTVRSFVGLAEDIYANPLDVLIMFAGKLPLGKGRTLGGQLGKTRVAQKAGKFATRPRSVATGEGLPTGSGIKRQWAKFKKHPRPDTWRAERAITTKKAFHKEYLQKHLDKIDEVFDNNANIMKQQLQEAAEKGSLDIQPKLKQYIKESSASYESSLEGIENGLAKSAGGNITRGEMHQVLTNTLDEALESGLPTGTAQSRISALRVKYGLEASPTTPLYGPQGELIKTIPKDINQTFDLKDVLNDIRSVRKMVSAGAKAGRAGYGADEMIVSYLNKNWGKFVETRVPELVNLNARYAPIIEGKKIAYKTFKPFAGEFNTKSGTDFLKRVATGKAEAGELRFLRQLEKGTEFASGIGDVSAPGARIGRALASNKQAKEAAKAAVDGSKYINGWLNKLNKIERQAVLNAWKRRGGMVAGGGLLLYLIKRHLIDKLLDSLTGGGSNALPVGGASG